MKAYNSKNKNKINKLSRNTTNEINYALENKKDSGSNEYLKTIELANAISQKNRVRKLLNKIKNSK
jgi:hypothetical protein